MPLAQPRFVVLDSSTLGNVSRDYWSKDESLRSKARRFVERLRDGGVYLCVTFSHVIELLRHNDEAVVRNRLSFLRSLPFIAWLRPYNRVWFPGTAADLLRRELHAFVHDAKRDWRAIVEQVRPDLWETGVGSDMFVDNDHLWSVLRNESQNLQRHEGYVASVARTDPGHVNDLTVGEAKKLPRRPQATRAAYMRQFQAAMKEQLDRHGDPRLGTTDDHARHFANDRLREINLYESMGGDPIERMLECRGVPSDLVNDQMTVGDVGALAVYVLQLEQLSEDLNPHAKVTIRDVPRDSLPSYVLSNRLEHVQRKALQVSGSDLGDAHIAMLTLYADAVEVDKRTHEFLGQVRRANPMLRDLMSPFFRSADYAAIPSLCEG